MTLAQHAVSATVCSPAPRSEVRSITLATCPDALRRGDDLTLHITDAHHLGQINCLHLFAGALPRTVVDGLSSARYRAPWATLVPTDDQARFVGRVSAALDLGLAWGVAHRSPEVAHDGQGPVWLIVIDAPQVDLGDSADLWRAVNRLGIAIERVTADPPEWRARTPAGVCEYGPSAEWAVRAVVQSFPSRSRRKVDSGTDRHDAGEVAQDLPVQS